MLGGLAAGLGLAWLAQFSLGLGEALGQFLLIALLALAAMVVVAWLMRSRKPAVASGAYAFPGCRGGQRRHGAA
jgi:predicted lipid-binding transport protein (Tim44 family)